MNRVEEWGEFKRLFGKNGTVPLDDRFRCEENLLSVLKQKEKGHLCGEGERSCFIPTGSKWEWVLAVTILVVGFFLYFASPNPINQFI